MIRGRDKKLQLALTLILLIGSCIFAIVFLFQERFCQITDFRNNVISYASAHNIDADRLSLFYFLFLILLYLSVCQIIKLISLDFFINLKDVLINLIRKLYSSSKKGFLKYVIELACFIYVIYRFYKGNPLQAGISFAVIFLFGLLYKDITLAQYIKVSTKIFVGVYALMIILNLLFIYLTGRLLNVWFLFSALILSTFLFYKLYYKNERKYLEISLFLVVSILTYCILYEINYSLISRGINNFTVNLIWVLSYLLLMFSFFLLKKKLDNINTSGIVWNDNTYYLLSLTSFSLIASLRQYKVVNYYEAANHGISISHFIRYGDIPIVDTFDAHMLSNSIPGILYYWFTRDYEGALQAPYTYIYIVILLVSVFLIVKSITNSELAILITLFFPIDHIVAESVALPCDSVFMCGLFMVPIYMHWKRKKNIFSTFLLWLFAAVSVLIQLDIAIAFGISAIILSIIELIRDRNLKNFVIFVVTGIIMSVVGVAVLLAFVINKYDLSYWIYRFLMISNSNQNWAVTNLSKFDIFFFYLLYPLLFFIYVFLCDHLSNISDECRSIVKFILFSYILNSVRTVVRHTVNESIVYVTAFMFLTILILTIDIAFNSIYEKNRSVLINRINLFSNIKESFSDKPRFNAHGMQLTGKLVGILLLLSCIGRGNYFDDLNKGLVSSHDVFKEGIETDTSIMPVYNNLENVFNTILEPEETFFDFSNYTNVYSYINRDNPVYENQCPGLINGKECQLDVIHTLETQRERIPLVLMNSSRSALGISLDEIDNIDRYYLLTGYIYDNYMPLYNDGDFEIWCLKTRFNRYVNLIDEDKRTDNVDCIPNNHYLGYIPYLWMKYGYLDLKDCESNYDESVKDFDDLIADNIIFLLIQIDSIDTVENINMNIFFKNGENETYSYNVMEGQNEYLICINTSYNFHLSEIKRVVIDDDRVNLESMKFMFAPIK